MTTSVELRRVTPFFDLPEEQIEWFLSHADELSVRAGETFVQQGDPAGWMFVFLEGQFQWRGEFGGDNVSLPARAGEISGVFPFSRMKTFTVTGVAISNGRLLKFPSSRLPELIQKMPELTNRLVAMMSDRIREGTRIEQHRDRLVSLGKLAAGLAHELNNPASAALRATLQIRDTLENLRSANATLWRRPIQDPERAQIERVEASLLQSAHALKDGLTLSDQEERLELILRDHGFANPFDLSAALARGGMSAEALVSLLTELNAETASAALARIAAAAELSVLLSVVESSTRRVSDLIRTMKEYTSMDQAGTQDIDVVRSLETTLDMLTDLQHARITVQREYQPGTALVSAVGGELSQVWTNVIQNAIEAMRGQGELRIRTFREGDYAVTEIGDNGPGIPSQIQSHIFDPFFTTKAIGEGTGLGLSTVQTIVRKHGGSVHVSSRAGDTRFQIWLPCAARSASEPTPNT